MAFDIQQDSLLTLAEAAAAMRRPVHVSTLHRWRLRGVRGIKLETVLVGGNRFTTMSAVQRFSEAVTAAAEDRTGTLRESAARSRAVHAAEEQLALDGF